MKHYQLDTRWAHVVLKHPFKVIFACILLVVLLAVGAQHVTISSDYRYFFGKDNPQRTAFEKLQSVYSKDDSVLITVTPKDGRVFKPHTLKGLIYLTKESWLLPYVTRVDSVTNFQYSYAKGDNLIVRDLVKPDDIDKPGFAARLKQLQAIALAEPMLRNRLINKHATVTGLNIKMTFPGKSPLEVPKAAEAARKLAKKFQQQFPGHQVHLTGMVMLNDAFNEAGIRDVITLMPIMYLLIIAMLFFFLRNTAGVLTTLGVMIFSIIAGVGFSGWVKIPITPPSSIAPTVIMTLAIAHSIHILKTLLKQMSNGIAQEQAIIESLKQNLRPVFLTSLTTIIGFLSLNFSDTPPFQDLGNITAVGVAIAFVLSIGFLPAVMSRVKIKAPKPQTRDSKLATRYSGWLERKSRYIIPAMLLITVFMGIQISNIKINDQFVGYFNNSIQFRPDSEYTIKNLTGVYQLNFDLGSGRKQGIADPAYLKRLEDFSNYMRSLPNVVHVSTMSDVFKRLNRNMHGDDPSWYRLPEKTTWRRSTCCCMK